jgi:Zn finger protein HypA/HybF involved in hydrogenase expression
MQCPGCKKQISRVNVYSECYQHGYLEGNKIASYGSVEEILETVAIECPECGHDLEPLVEET